MTFGRNLTHTIRIGDNRVVNGLLTLSGLVLIGMGLLMVYNIAARSLFNAPVDGIVTIVSDALMIAVIYLAFAAPAHIAVRIFVDGAPALVRRGVDTITWALSLAVLAVGAWASTTRAIDSFERGERTVGTFTFALYPYRFLVAAGLLVAAIHVIVVGRRWVSGVSVEDPPHHDEAPPESTRREGLGA